MPARAFTIQIWHGDEDSDDGGYFTTYEQYVNRRYESAGGDTYEEAMAIAARDLIPVGHHYQIIETATGLPVTRRMMDERNPDPNAERKSMIKLNVKREGGRVFLYVNAKGMHDVLDQIGVPTDGGILYKDRPRTTFMVADRVSNTLSTEVLLRKEYPAKFDLSTVYADPPPSFSSLQRLTESAFEQSRKILEHYQPIDISVSIQKKDK